MSLVQIVITEKFVLAAADTRAIKPDNTILENHNKLVKLNKQIIFGCTGGELDNFTLFKGFCDYSEEYGLTKINKEINITYTDFINILIQRFILMKKIHDDTANHIKYSIMSIACGYNGNEFEAMMFNLTPESENENGISIVKKSHDFPYKCISAGKIEHRNEFEMIANRYHDTGFYDFTTVRQYKNILREVFDNGIKIDSEINNNIVFERMNLRDVFE